MYRAKINIGEYKEGQIVPDELAETWLKMYLYPPVEKVCAIEPEGKLVVDNSEPVKKEESKSQSEQVKPEVPSGDMLPDYLGRNTNVVVKNVQTDNLNKKQLNELLALEKSNKKRSVVIKALEKRLEETK